MFKTDDKVQEVAKSYAQDCVDWVASNFSGKISWEDRNIIAIERFLDDLSKRNSKNPLANDRLETFEKMFGFYFGEVFIRNHGKLIWGWAVVEGERIYALCEPNSRDVVCYLILKVKDRITISAEHNVWAYYSALIEYSQNQGNP